MRGVSNFSFFFFNFLTPTFSDKIAIESWLPCISKDYTENGLNPAAWCPLTIGWGVGGIMSSQGCLTNWLYLVVLTMEKDCVTVLKAANSTNKCLLFPKMVKGESAPDVFLWLLNNCTHTPWSFPISLPLSKFLHLLWYQSYWDKAHPKGICTVRVIIFK